MTTTDDPTALDAALGPGRPAGPEGQGSGRATAELAEFGGRRIVVARTAAEAGVLRAADAEALRDSVRRARLARIPLLLEVAAEGTAVEEAVAAGVAWGRVAAELAAASGVVPTVAIVTGPLLAGPALLLGLVDQVVVVEESLAYVSGPPAVAELTGEEVTPEHLGGPAALLRRSGVASLAARDLAEARELVAELLAYLPDHTDAVPDLRPSDDPPARPTPELEALLPASPTGSYDVRDLLGALCDEGRLFELREGYAPQLVTALGHIGEVAVGFIANQPQTLAGTLDIQASQKGARFVSFCDAFNLPLVTIVDTPGFLPGRDQEWRGMIRHGAELAFAYAEATVPRICVVVRKAYGGAYIVMDSKAMGNDLTLAWPSAEIAVMGADAAVQILHRRAGTAERARAAADYRERYLAPWLAAELGLVDEVIEPTQTRATIARALHLLVSKREPIRERRHSNTPL